MEKLCIFCEHCEWENSLAWGSTWTGEYGARGFGCGKGHFSPYGKGDARGLDEIDDIRELFLTAEKCPDYKPPNAQVVRREAAGVASERTEG